MSLEHYRPLIDMKDFRLMYAVAKHASVTGAANELSLSQSALSHQLAKLESKLNLSLFDRIGKRMVVTHAGQILAEFSEKKLTEVQALEQTLIHQHSTHKKPLRITASCLTYYSWLTQAVVDFTSEDGSAELQIHHQERKREQQALESGEVDLIITTHPASASNIEKQALFPLSVVVLIAKDHPLAKLARDKKSISWTVLEEERIFIHDVPIGEENYLRRAIGAAQPNHPLSVQRIHMSEAIIQFVKMNQGVGLVLKWRGEFSKLDPDITLIIPKPKEERMLWAVSLKSNPRQLPIEAFIERIRALDKS